MQYPRAIAAPWSSARACPGLPSEFSTHSSHAPDDRSPDVLAVALSLSRPRPCGHALAPRKSPVLVGGTITLNEAYFATKNAVDSGTTASTALGCVALLT